MRDLKRIIVGKNFVGNLGQIMADNKTVLWDKVEENIEGGFKVVNNKFQFINYRNMALVAMVNDIVKGNVNGRVSAELLWNVFKDDREATNDRAKIEWWLKTITLGQVTTKPGGLCYWSPDNRLLILNETRENWQSNRSGERDRMYIIGDCCEQQGIVYRYLPKAAPDESTVLILALPNPKSVTDAFKAQMGGPKPVEEDKEPRTVGQILKEVTESVAGSEVLPTTIADKPKEIPAPTVRRDIKRKGRKEVDITQLEENVTDDE